LGLRVAHALAEESGIATEVLYRRERNRIDPLLDRDEAGGLKLGDPDDDLTKPSSALAGSARLIQPYRSASSAL